MRGSGVRLLQEGGGDAQVNLSVADAGVAEVGTQQRQPGHDVLAVAIPEQQPGDGESRSQVVEPGTAAVGFPQPRLDSEVMEYRLDGRGAVAGAATGDEEGPGRVGGGHCDTQVVAGAQRLQRPGGDRDEPGLAVMPTSA